MSPPKRSRDTTVRCMLSPVQRSHVTDESESWNKAIKLNYNFLENKINMVCLTYDFIYYCILFI